jgi:hypothetical protein
MVATVGYWFFASSALSSKLDALNGHAIAPGITISFAQKTVSGFPFRLDSEMDGLRVQIVTSHGPAVWTAEHVASHSFTYGRTQYIFEAAGKQHIEWHDDRGQLHTYDFLPGTLRASLIASGGKLSRFDLDLANADSMDVAASHVQLHLRQDPNVDGLDLYATAANVYIAPQLKPAFGPSLKRFRVDALISPGTSFDGLLSGGQDWRAAAENWRTRHGGVLVNSLVVAWGKLDTDGKGALAVDALHRPMGSLKLRIGNWRALAQRARQSGKMGGGNRGLAAGLLATVQTAQTGGLPLNTALSFQNGIVFVGTVPADLLSPLY